MTAPLNAFQTNFGRFYRHPSAGISEYDPNSSFAPKPSITNIIGMLDKKFLPPHYAKLVAEYAIQRHDAIGDLIKRFGPQVAIGTLKAIPSQPNAAAAIGDEVHDAIDLWSKGLEDEIKPFSTTTAAAMFVQFRYFATQFPFKVVRSEYTVWSYEHGYAGTGDNLWETEEGLWIVDTKTGNRVYPTVAMQTSAIAHADAILDGEGNEHSMPKAKIQGVVHVRPRSVKLHKLYRTDEAFETFLALKRAFDWTRFDQDLVIQEPFKTERPKEAK